MDCNTNVKAFIEISKGSNLKYEFDKENQCLALDRILHNSNVFPYNYGYVPNTLSDDGDPLDIIILCDYAIHPRFFNDIADVNEHDVNCIKYFLRHYKDGDIKIGQIYGKEEALQILSKLFIIV